MLQILHLSVWELRDVLVHIPSEEGLSWELRVWKSLRQSGLNSLPHQIHLKQLSGRPKLTWAHTLRSSAHHNNIQLIPVDNNGIHIVQTHAFFRINTQLIIFINYELGQGPAVLHSNHRGYGT